MEVTTGGKERLEEILLRLDRLGRTRRGSVRRHVEVPSWAAGGNGARLAGPISGPGEPAPAEQSDPPVPEGERLSAPVREVLDDLLKRLEILEARVSLMGRPVPASREAFSEWIRLRKHEEMSFGDYLRLRRAGLV